ncbi:MAG: LacI family DNA-binding transcriptional regulator [Planctomycetota bacterium]|jgi:DNA-binding LacI/PurR family transcriptional regulator|nr:LacI family DNA-binding transcriptional regulator [Planctomycetota bacterium]
MPVGKNGDSVTSIDVARLAGVSQATVSRVFSANGNFSGKAAKKVLGAARTLGYRPNAIARSLVSSKSGLIGIVKGYSENPIFQEALTRFTYLIQDAGKQVLYFESRRHEDIDEVMGNVLQYQVEGIILLYAAMSSALTLSCQQRNIPVLQMLRHSSGCRANIFVSDNHKAAGEVAGHLIDRGYRHFIYVSGELNSSINAERHAGIVDKLGETGCPPPMTVEGDFTYDSGRKAVRKIVKKSLLPCGVICASDMMALGALDGLRHDLGLRTPRDAGVAGFDDVSMASWPSYSLTSVRLPISEMVRDALEALCLNIEDKAREPVVRKYAGILVKRRSTARKGKD